MSVLNKFKNMFKDKPAEGSSKSAAQGSSSTPVQGKTSSTQGGKAQPHIWAVSTETKQSLAKGVKFNMKVVIKGMRRTGKSSLMRLLNGLGPDATTEYVPTPQIAASTIYLPSSTDPSEGAKVEIWEVVDEAAQSRPANSADRVRAHDGAVAVDASVLDVYKGSHAAIFMVDGTRRETFDYAKREAALVPPQCSILICLNFYDKDEHFRVVSDHDVDDFCQSLNGACTPLLLQAAGGNPSSIPRELSVAASWMPCSMTTGMGFSAIQAFLEIPFALVQLDSLEKQMRTLYRAVDSVRANMLQERAELRFQLRHGTSPLEAPQPKSPNPGLAAKASNAIPIATQAAVSLASSLPKSPHVAQAIKAVVPIAAAAVLKPQPKSASSTSAAPVPAKAAPKTGAAPPATDDPKKVLDNFFDDDNEYDDEDEQPESDGDHHAPTPPPAPRRSMVTAQPAKAPVQVVPPTAAPVAPLPKPAAPAAQENAKEAPTTTVEAKSNPPAPATPPVAQQEQPAASPEVESVAATKHQEFVDVSSLGKSEVVQGFFGDDDDDADEKGDNEEEEGPGAVAAQPQAATSRDPPTTTADPTTAVVPEPAKQDSAAAARKAPRKLGAAKDDGSSEEDVKPSAVKGTRRPVGATRQPAPVVIAPPVAAAVVPPSVDLNALLSQFSSALQTTPEEAASADPEEGGDPEKKSKKDKKDKTAKKEKKDKKDKSSKKSEGDLNPPADDGDDIVVVRGSDD